MAMLLFSQPWMLWTFVVRLCFVDCRQGEVREITDSCLESQNKQEILEKVEIKQQDNRNWFSRSFWPSYKVLVIEVVGSDKIGNTEEIFLNELSKKLKINNIRIQKAQLDNESRNLVLLFCPVVTRIGNDIAVALKKVSSNKKIILVVMYHTSNPDYRVADSSRFVDQKNVVLTVDCLFHETTGLLNCNLNKESSHKVFYFIYSYI
ncbi:uncharacterized protein LOC120536403 [Polypterus senegalus]|uniref:uncharacterized protein LOC120536403 n=1 Tax=Polypterus senegalus TaxID=55291 RepID=UPI00196453D2|nr:uncharacterized protein LOC120536403 [Polypterus senegalus]